MQELANEIRKVTLDKYGVQVLHHLVHPRDPRFFGKGTLELFRKGDANAHSKKVAADRFVK